MFSELPKLFERNFAMAFFMPVIIFIGVSLLILDQYQLNFILDAIVADTLIGVTILGLLSWLGGIVLLVSNHDLYRFIEGYGKYNPVKWLMPLQKHQFQSLKKRLEKLDDEYRETGPDFPAEKRTRRNRIIRVLADHYPDDERWLLPTAFGNTLRAFETYPRFMYGFDAIGGWSRILALVPDSYRKLIDNAKTQVDFWVNLGLLSLILLVEYLGIAIYYSSIEAMWIFWFILLCALVAPYRAKRVAIEWGELVKSVFDLYRFDVLKAMRIELPKNRAEERKIWTKISQSMMYKLPDELPEINTLKEKLD